MVISKSREPFQSLQSLLFMEVKILKIDEFGSKGFVFPKKVNCIGWSNAFSESQRKWEKDKDKHHQIAFKYSRKEKTEFLPSLQARFYSLN